MIGPYLSAATVSNTLWDHVFQGQQCATKVVTVDAVIAESTVSKRTNFPDPLIRLVADVDPPAVVSIRITPCISQRQYTVRLI